MQRSQVDEGQMVRWLCQLLLALDYLQTKKVLHRDIKTSNLMLTNDYDVQIGDFGLATRMQDKGMCQSMGVVAVMVAYNSICREAAEH